MLQVYAGTHYCGKISYRPTQAYYVVPCQGVRADYVKITLANDYLQLAEVQVIGKLTTRHGNDVSRDLVMTACYVTTYIGILYNQILSRNGTFYRDIHLYTDLTVRIITC